MATYTRYPCIGAGFQYQKLLAALDNAPTTLASVQKRIPVTYPYHFTYHCVVVLVKASGSTVNIADLTSTRVRNNSGDSSSGIQTASASSSMIIDRSDKLRVTLYVNIAEYGNGSSWVFNVDPSDIINAVKIISVSASMYTLTSYDNATYPVAGYWGIGNSTFGTSITLTTAPAEDINLKAKTAGGIIKISTSKISDMPNRPLRITKGGVLYGIELVSTDDPNATPFRIKTGAGIRAIAKL
ncbi:MAG: hypothetical protein NTU66_06010 [Elusimicrobia bacterium]|nr:hypothetical protein [Elusimicrobiota bacterium]